MPLLDLVPVISAIIGIIGISFKAGQIIQKLDYVIAEVHELKQETKEIKTELKDMDKRVTVIETKNAGSNQKNI